MTTPKKMTPAKNGIPFTQGSVVATPIVQKIDRGIRDLGVNYQLQDRLVWLALRYPTKREIQWNFTLHVLTTEMLDENGVPKFNFAEMLESGKLPKPIVSVTHKSFAGINRFLTECAKAIQKKYGQTVQQRKTA